MGMHLDTNISSLKNNIALRHPFMVSQNLTLIFYHVCRPTYDKRRIDNNDNFNQFVCVYQKLETLSIWYDCCCITSQLAMVLTSKHYYPNMLPSNETPFCLLSLDYARKMLLVLVKIDKEAYYNLLNEVNVISCF